MTLDSEAYIARTKDVLDKCERLGVDIKDIVRLRLTLESLENFDDEAIGAVCSTVFTQCAELLSSLDDGGVPTKPGPFTALK